MVQFAEITNSQKEEIDKALQIYTHSFPANEKHPIELIRERIAKGLNRIFTGSIGDEVVFIALLWPLKDTDFILLDYMATSPEHRGKNISSHLWF
jgi:hypothetical protein